MTRTTITTIVGKEELVGLKHAVLAALLEGEASGYELSKRFDVGVANFWSATSQQLYRELEQLEGDGFVDVQLVEQERRPNKRVLSLNEAGRRELHAFTTEPAKPNAMRDDLVVKLQAIDVGDAEAVMESLADRIARSHAKLAVYERLREHYLAGRTDEQFLGSGERVGPYLTLMGGQAFEQANIAWMTSVYRIVERLVADGRL